MGDIKEKYDNKYDGVGHSDKQSVFQRSIQQYIIEIGQKPKSKKRDFIVDIIMHDTPTEEDMQASFKNLKSKYSSEARRKETSTVVDPLVRAFRHYYNIIDKFIQAYPMPTALIWGGLKTIIDLGARFISLIELISEELKQLTEQINRLVSLEGMYQEFSPVQDLLCASYINILRFLCEVNKQARKNELQQFASASFSHTKIIKIIEDLKKNADQVDHTAVIAENQLHAGARSDARIEAVKTGCERIEVQKERKNQVKWRQEGSCHKDHILRTELRAWLRGDNAINRGTFENLLHKCQEGSGQWLLENQTFCSWLDDEFEKPTLWLHAPAGAGKSVLCAFIVKVLQSPTFNRNIAFIFISDGDPVSGIQNLRNLAEQLLLRYYEMFPGTPQALTSLLHKDNNELIYVKDLILFLVKELKRVYIFIDGLNETSDATQWDDNLEFLRKLAEDSSGKTRIWVSSQDTTLARNFLGSFKEFDGSRHYMSLDIEAYINAQMPICIAESGSDSVSRFHMIVREKARNNFLWATQMIDLLKEADSDGEQTTASLAELPATTDQYYQTIMDRIRREDASRNNIVSLMLSLITFSRRPLSLAEIREAIATCRSKDGSNFDQNYLPFPQTLLDLCAPLVEFIHTSDAAYDGVFRLGHSVVRTFLTNQANLEVEHLNATLTASTREVPRVPFISKTLFAECCLRYLSQPKYSQLLQKEIVCEWGTTYHGDIEDHVLLFYAANYWDEHFDDVVPSRELCEKISRFVKSPNFQTCIQIQASFVISRFVQSHTSSGRSKFTKRFLPDWPEYECGKEFTEIRAAYIKFIDEWGELLQQGTDTPFSGEIDRCFWGALGPGNFLNANYERYISFMFMQPSDLKLSDFKPSDSVVYAEAMSSDLSKLKLLSFSLNGTTASVRSRQELWDLHGDQPPSHIGITEHTISNTENYTKNYSTSNRKFAITPQTTSQYRAQYVDLTEDQSLLRLGSSLFTYTENDMGHSFVPFPQIRGISTAYWEEIASRGSFFAVARRRKPYDKESRGLARHLKKLIEVSSSREVDSPEDSDVEGTEGSSSSIASVSDLEGSDISSDDLGDISSPEESWSDSENSSNHESGSRPGSPESSFEMESEMEGSDLDSDLESLDNFDDRSVASASSEDAQWLPHNDSHSTGFSFCCDVCNHLIVDDTHYHCETCHYGQFDVCKSCLERGEWCPNKRHQLFHQTNYGETLNILSADDLSTGHDLVILQKQTDTASVLFHTHLKSHRLIYESPPVFHPSLSLLVWPTGEGLLFADFNRNSYFEQKLFASNKNACHVSVQLHFSDCGKYLHLLSVEVTKPERTKGDKKRSYKPHLSVHLSTFQLSATKPSKSPPQTIFRTNINLGQCISPLVTRLPINVTWAGREAYVIFGYTQLVLYKIVLFANPEQPSARNIFVPEKPISLPHSAQNRRLRFFPASMRNGDGSKALLLISGCSGDTSARPTGVYLSEEDDLGGWTALSDSLRLIDDLRITQRLEGKFENFDEDDDCCDPVPFSLRGRA